MVRDGRATVNSIISRKITITGFDHTSYRQCMTKWNHAIETMHNQCKEIGSNQCMMVITVFETMNLIYNLEQRKKYTLIVAFVYALHKLTPLAHAYPNIRDHFG